MPVSKRTAPRAPRRLAAILSVALMAITGCDRPGNDHANNANTPAGGSGPPLVVYCAHDAIFAEAVLEQFQKDTGLAVSVRYDTEATKSLGLSELIVAERNNPRCDVFWNNQMLGTAQLKSQGLLEPYKGAGYQRIPDGFKDPDGAYAGFAARLRVYIVNTRRMPATPEAVAEKLAAASLSRVAIAKPMFGTTLTHYSVLWDLWGPVKLRLWHHDWRRRGVIERGGNASVKNLVAEGVCDMGLTDTDDFFVAKDEGMPVTMLPVRLDKGQVICIPNTVAIVRGTQRLDDAKKLVDYLLSEKVELQLAASKSRQIPLGPVDEAKLPGEVKALRAYVAEAYPLAGLAEARSACLAWLKTEYLK